MLVQVDDPDDLRMVIECFDPVCRSWDLKVNTGKRNSKVFAEDGTVRDVVIWEACLEEVEQFVVVLNERVTVDAHIKSKVMQERMAMNAIRGNSKPKMFEFVVCIIAI